MWRCCSPVFGLDWNHLHCSYRNAFNFSFPAHRFSLLWKPFIICSSFCLPFLMQYMWSNTETFCLEKIALTKVHTLTQKVGFFAQNIIKSFRKSTSASQEIRCHHVAFSSPLSHVWVHSRRFQWKSKQVEKLSKLMSFQSILRMEERSAVSIFITCPR